MVLKNDWCQPPSKGNTRQFVVMFEDTEMGIAVFEDEAEARKYFERANINWNCTLFGAMPVNE
jgi:hypothetical protein